MPNFKQFTLIDGRRVHVNVDDISLVEPFSEDAPDGYVRVTFNNGNQVALATKTRFIVDDD